MDEIDPEANYGTTLEEKQIDRCETTLQRLKAFTDAEFVRKLQRAIEEK